jgi:hypothetical protein
MITGPSEQATSCLLTTAPARASCQARNWARNFPSAAWATLKTDLTDRPFEPDAIQADSRSPFSRVSIAKLRRRYAADTRKDPKQG